MNNTNAHQVESFNLDLRRSDQHQIVSSQPIVEQNIPTSQTDRVMMIEDRRVKTTMPGKRTRHAGKADSMTVVTDVQQQAQVRDSPDRDMTLDMEEIQ